ncbi:16S rRNA (guanine(966)-N(2))-methyltransferase RsmD [Paenalcaligenes niemegkensis]|uniref:16S rRNA (guanine(966)-N(2))-methyltransferase RsmD n=1 Tax=Paenalcaligenes niemegkensis TaxID=2895469 RepID=UPI001EE7EFE7|nr:16S rRNA (guanine(966)-N(2))-methyltransferase RsmD [Paenalcaligenes niemegkensis]MCQ9615346.1 16S rRNA (guanine(966)-N(2))-methyltransferase RsmD [Paenalcaligenes niemegkensis]
MKKHTIRIVGGDYRRTPLIVTDAEGLRPTPDRVRETLFNWLRHFWEGNFSDKRVLDLFAGSGALGFEAASHGVAHVQMVENNKQAVAALRSVRNKLGADTVRIHDGDALHVLQRTEAPYDLIFIDPPFGKNWLDKVWPILPMVLAPDALIYVESEVKVETPPHFELEREQRAGHVYFHLFRFAATQETDNNA